TTTSLVNRLASRSFSSRASFTASQLDTLPPPVARYFRAALRDGQPIVRRARLEWEGTFLMRPERRQWVPFTAVQNFASNPPGFVWDARMSTFPGFDVRVRDGFVKGWGSMHASVMGLFPLADAEGTPEIARAGLQRYLAEAVWHPTSLLPSQGVAWSAI